MMSICEKKISGELRPIHAEQISLYKFHRIKKRQQTQLQAKQVKQDILNQWESMGFLKLNVMDVPSLHPNYTAMELNYDFRKKEPLTLKLLFSKQ